MITITEINGKSNHTSLLELYGLSTDEKPAGIYQNIPVGNASTFYEIDTGDMYMFDAESQEWIKH